MPMVVSIVFIVVTTVMVLAIANDAKRRGRSPFGWGLLAFLMGPIGWVIWFAARPPLLGGNAVNDQGSRGPMEPVTRAATRIDQVRNAQRAQGFDPCFATDPGSCGQAQCCYRSECEELASLATGLTEKGPGGAGLRQQGGGLRSRPRDVSPGLVGASGFIATVAAVAAIVLFIKAQKQQETVLHWEEGVRLAGQGREQFSLDRLVAENYALRYPKARDMLLPQLPADGEPVVYEVTWPNAAPRWYPTLSEAQRAAKRHERDTGGGLLVGPTPRPYSARHVEDGLSAARGEQRSTGTFAYMAIGLAGLFVLVTAVLFTRMRRG